MYPDPFEWAEAGSFSDAVDLLRSHGDGARIIAGGQSLVPMMHLRLVRPAVLVDVNGFAPATGVRRDGDRLAIHGLARQRELERSPEVRNGWPLLAEAASHVGNPRVRNRGTVAGSLAHADPAAEITCAALALGGEVEILGPGGERGIPVGDLSATFLTTTLGPAEVVTGLRLPPQPRGAGQAFLELARRPGEFAVANMAAVVGLAGGVVEHVRLAGGGIGERALDLTDAAAAVLVGSPPSAAALDEVGERVAAACDPYDDAHATAGYRREMAEVLARRALALAARRAGNGAG